MAGLGLSLLAVGAMLVGVATYRGRHRAGHLPGH
jgi:hypothetical protein